MPKKRRDAPEGISTVRFSGTNCPHVEIDWDKAEAYIVDDYGGMAKFTSLHQLWELSSRISVTLCEGGHIPE